jgi:uncharacterized membrane protein
MNAASWGTKCHQSPLKTPEKAPEAPKTVENCQVLVCAGTKRKNPDPLGEEYRRKKKHTGPVVGSRPVILFKASWELPDRKRSGEVRVRVLLDTGAMVAMVSSAFVSLHNVPKVKRDVPNPICDFSEKPVPGSGEAFSLPITLERLGHYSRDVFEIGPLESGVDIILPFNWLAEHPPTGLWTPERLRFDNKVCKGCTKKALDNSFDIVYDSKLNDPSLASVVGQLGYIMAVNTHSNASNTNILESLPEQYQEFRQVFEPQMAESLPPHREFDHAIDLKDGEQPPWGPIYALSGTELEALRTYLDKMLAEGKIRPSKSPAGAPILFVPKPEGRGLRLCVDYRGLNRVTIMNRFPLPLMNELQDRIQGARLFTKLDLKNGYNLIRIKAGDEWKTAFRTRYGLYEYLVMPFGLANAPATFQAMMNTILRDLLDLGVIVYIDDILIYSKTKEEHEKLVKEVLSRLQRYGLAASMDKCVFHQNKVDFLGYVISDQGISMAEDKVKTILDWHSPKSVKDVQSFIGFANFYRRFIDGFSKICKPITDSLREGGAKFEWTEPCEEAFRELKHRFTTAPILRHFDPESLTQLETDASDFAIGAVLSQLYIRIWHPVAFHSRKMAPAEINYEIHDKELLAIVDAFKQWRRYLESPVDTVLIYTDHKNLEYFMTTKVLNRRQARWAQELAEFNFKIIYRQGSSNGKPDALSRRSEFRPKEGGINENQPIHRVLAEEHFDLESIKHRDNTLIVSATGLVSSAPKCADIIVCSSSRLKNLPVVQFSATLKEQVSAAAITDEEYQARLQEVLQGQAKEHFTIEDNLLHYKQRLYIPESDEVKLQIAAADHDSKCAGHFGIDKTVELVTRNFYWPKMTEWVSDYVRSCHQCQENKSARHAKYGLLQPLEMPHAPWTSISMDFITELPKSNGHTSIWVIVDRFSKMAHFIALKEPARAKELARIFVKEQWRLHGLPEDIVSDRDSRFNSNVWKSLCEMLEVRQRMSTAFHPQTDGQTERVNQTLEAFVRTFCGHDMKDWEELLPIAEYAYNNSVSASTKFSPFFVNYGYNPRTNWPKDQPPVNPTSSNYVHWLKAIHEECETNLARTRERMGRYYDQKRSEPREPLREGSLVMLDGRFIKTRRPTKKFDQKYWGPFRIEKVISPTAFRLQLPTNWRIHNVFHISLLEPYRTSAIPGRPQPSQTDILNSADEIEEQGVSDDYEPEEIMQSRLEEGNVEYLVRWVDFPEPKDWTWEPWEHLKGASELLKEFHEKHPDKPKDSRMTGQRRRLRRR